jgi:hypothetical protein
VARFLSDGSFDSAFGSNGVTETNIAGTDHDGAGAVALDGNGQIVVAGYAGLFGGITNPNKGFALLRSPGGDSRLRALGGPAPANASVPTVTNEQMLPLLDEAVARWIAAGADPSKLANLTVQIADLDGGMLGLASGNTIWLDSNAAGWGWFVDATPWDDSEYSTPGNQGEQGRMDLLTAIAHELGHLLGFDHSESGVMDDTLAAGVRTLPAVATAVSEPAVVDSVLALDWTGRHHRQRDDVIESLSGLFSRSNRLGLGRVNTIRQ